MSYCSVGDLRRFLQFTPIRVTDEKIGVGDGVTKEFHTLFKPIVDPDYDGVVIDDVEVKVGGLPVQVSSVDCDEGCISLLEPPPPGLDVTASYSWHPVSDHELKVAIDAAEGEIDSECGRSFKESLHEERVYLSHGNTISLLNTPVIRIESIIVESHNGEVLEELKPSMYECYPELGVIRLKKYCAGVVLPPWYVPTAFYVRVRYLSGYSEVPGIVKQAALLLSSYHVLSRISMLYTTEPEYQGRISMVFKKPGEIFSRLEFLRKEVERIKKNLPRQVKVL
ncbi:MAG: hypothetical protein QXY32_03885 [Nitrososphaerota archaeon]